MKPQNYLLQNIPEKLWLPVRHQAVDEGCTIKELVLRALREYLERKAQK